MPKYLWFAPLVPFVGLTFNRAVYHYGLFIGFGDTGADVAAFIGTFAVGLAALIFAINRFIDEISQ